MTYFECGTCCYATSYAQSADDHAAQTGHAVAMTYAAGLRVSPGPAQCAP